LQNSAQHISYGKIQTFFNLKSITTTRKYVQLLKDAFLIHEIQGYSNKLTERSTSSRKVYACDLGMMKALWSKPTQDLGSKLETLILIELLRRSYTVFYLKQHGREVDFCIVENGKPKALIQVCFDLSDQKTRERELRALYEMGEAYGVKDLCVITRDQEECISYKGVSIRVMTVVQYLMG
jgi:predicted AAA+ superfamily ATPase